MSTTSERAERLRKAIGRLTDVPGDPPAPEAVLRALCDELGLSWEMVPGGYTPGPWITKQVRGFGANNFVWSASPDGHPYNDYSYIAQDVSGFANAELITKAPCLADALATLLAAAGLEGEA